MMPTIVLVRHGETDWNRSGQIMGERPVPLNQQGEAQAQRLASLLKDRPVHALCSSPVARALQTAQILASALQVPVTIDRGLTEIGVGQWEGRFWKDLADEIVRQNFYRDPLEARPPGGETLSEVQARAVATVERVMAGASEGAGPLLFVSHADVVRAILAHYLRFDLQTVRQIRIDHASLTALHLNGNTVDLLCLNYTPGLNCLQSID
jgi:broad specificity phosphatase PhoE